MATTTKTLIPLPVVNPVGGPIATMPRRDQVSRFKVPDWIPEEAEIPSFVFSRQLLERAKIEKLETPRSRSEWEALRSYAPLARQVAAETEGGPTVGSNWIKIWIDDAHVNAGSNADHIWMHLGQARKIKLKGLDIVHLPQDPDTAHFPKGWWLLWDLTTVSHYLETIPTDAWDEVHLVNPFGDGIKLDRIKLVHSGVVILDWTPSCWLDGSKGEAHGRLGLAAPILKKKLSQVSNSWVPQIHWAARELGKSDGHKYGSLNAWCSEFASWCLRKALWDTPSGNIGSQKMENYFIAKDGGRMYTQAQLLDGDYKLNEGDYLRFVWEDDNHVRWHHSGLFMRYVDDKNAPSAATRIKTIEGNTSGTVGVRTRRLGDLESVGNTR